MYSDYRVGIEVPLDDNENLDEYCGRLLLGSTKLDKEDSIHTYCSLSLDTSGVVDLEAMSGSCYIEARVFKGIITKE